MISYSDLLYLPHGARLELSKVNDEIVIPVSKATRCSVQVVKTYSATWTTGIVTVRRSNDGEQPVALASPTTITAEGMTAIDVTDFAFLHLVVTTAEGTDNFVTAYVYLND